MSPSSPVPPGRSPTQAALLTRFPALQRLHLLHPTIPLPTLLVSFGLLHEITAIAPVVGLFYGFRAFGGGRAVVDSMIDLETRVRGEGGARMVEGWLEEGERKIERVGRRYGILGFPKTAREGAAATPAASSSPGSDSPVTISSKDLAGDVANAVGAYLVVKALLPVRIAASVYLAPPFARVFMLPIGRLWTAYARRRS